MLKTIRQILQARPQQQILRTTSWIKKCGFALTLKALQLRRRSCGNPNGKPCPANRSCTGVCNKCFSESPQPRRKHQKIESTGSKRRPRTDMSGQIRATTDFCWPQLVCPCAFPGNCVKIEWNPPGTLLEPSVFLGFGLSELPGTFSEPPGTLHFPHEIAIPCHLI